MVEYIVNKQNKHLLSCCVIISNISHCNEGWLIGCFGFNSPLRQYFSLYRAVYQKREGESREK